MFAKDDLDRLERDWARHVEWRKGARNGLGTDSPGKYVDTSTALRSGRGICLPHVPDSVEKKFFDKIEEFVAKELDAIFMAERRRLRLAARAEAERVLAETAEEA